VGGARLAPTLLWQAGVSSLGPPAAPRSSTHGDGPPPASEFGLRCASHLPALRARARRLAGAAPDAADLVQDTLLRAMRARARFVPGTDLRAWLGAILDHLFLAAHRQRRRRRQLEARFPDDLARATSPGAAAAPPAPLAGEVAAALAALPGELREVVDRADLRGERYREIAASTGLPIGTVMSRLFRARRLLERRLAAYARDHWGLRRAA
jgi:RNA polymerase sigma-70 factor (ECF subfamily)